MLSNTFYPTSLISILLPFVPCFLSTRLQNTSYSSCIHFIKHLQLCATNNLKYRLVTCKCIQLSNVLDPKLQQLDFEYSCTLIFINYYTSLSARRQIFEPRTSNSICYSLRLCRVQECRCFYPYRSRETLHGLARYKIINKC